MNFWERIARGIWAIGDAFNWLGDRINSVTIKRGEPTKYEGLIDAALRSDADKIADNVARNNALFDHLRKDQRK